MNNAPTTVRYAVRISNMAAIDEYAGDVQWLRFVTIPKSRHRDGRRAYRLEYRSGASVFANRETAERNLGRVTVPASYEVEIVEVAA